MKRVSLIALSSGVVYLAYLIIQRKKERTSNKPPSAKNGIDGLIGNTPLIRISSLSEATGCEIFAKMEMCNPAGSAKDRVALSIIRESERVGLLKPHTGSVLFEGTSGSTGISLAMLANALGYKAHICLPDDTSDEKLELLYSFGAEVEKVKPASIVDPNQYVNVARRRAQELTMDKTSDRVGVFVNQFENDFNWRCHYSGTAPEIWEQMDRNMDVFITGSGTGGTIAGCCRYFKEKSQKIEVILADPQGSGLYNRVKYGVMYDKVEREGTRRRHQVDTIIEGIGLNRMTHNFSIAENMIDDSIRVTDSQAIKMAKYLSTNDGLFVGSSSCINAVAAAKYARNYAEKGSRIVIIVCDSGQRHLSKFWKQALTVANDISLESVLM